MPREQQQQQQQQQQCLPRHHIPKTIGSLSKDYPEHVRKGNVYSAMKLLTNNLKNGILPLDNKTLEYLRQEHPTPSPPKDIMLLIDEIKTPHIYTRTLTQASSKATAPKQKEVLVLLLTGMDVDGWRRIIFSNQFRQNSDDLCHTLLKVARNLCTKEDLSASMEAFFGMSFDTT